MVKMELMVVKIAQSAHFRASRLNIILIEAKNLGRMASPKQKPRTQRGFKFG